MSHGSQVLSQNTFHQLLLFIQLQPAVEKKFQCDIYLQKFTRSANLNNHKESVHGEEGKQHTCRFQYPECDAQYRR